MWRDWIVIKPGTAKDEAYIRGTGIRVSTLLARFFAGASEAELRRDYPTLTRSALTAVMVYYASNLREQRMRRGKE